MSNPSNFSPFVTRGAKSVEQWAELYLSALPDGPQPALQRLMDARPTHVQYRIKVEYEAAVEAWLEQLSVERERIKVKRATGDAGTTKKAI